ncbi:MAG: hypothetical protein ACYSWT_01045 [Planctomycetota bacterium]|jgi:hypothetical protein
MSRLLAKIMLAMLMLPLATAVYVVVIVSVMELVYNYGGEIAPFVVTTIVVWAFIACYWTLLWRRTVRWTPRRIGLTLTAAVAGAGVGAVSGALVGLVEDSLGAFIGGVTTILFWLLGTVLIWRETTAERIERLRARSPDAMVCPACGYNLTGLRQTTCPECGASYTLDELAALQPGREAAEL